MSGGARSKRAILEDRVSSFDVIDEKAWSDLKHELAPISDRYLRALLIGTGRPLSPLVEGVQTADLEQAGRNLCALAGIYESADAPRRMMCRRLVIEAKQKIRWWLHRFPEGRSVERESKTEILLWTATWLENPLLFPDWMTLRRRRFSIEDQTTQP